MLCWISIFGGLLIMMGQHAGSEALFYYFWLEPSGQLTPPFLTHTLQH